MTSNSCLPSKERKAEFSLPRSEKPGDSSEDERRLDFVEGHPTQDPKKLYLNARNRNVLCLSGKMQASGRSEWVAEAKPSGDNKPVDLRPPELKTNVFRPSCQNASQRDALATFSEKRKDEVERRINHLVHVFFPPRPSTLPRTPTPCPPAQPSPVRDSSPKVTRVLYPFGTDWRTFFNYNEEDAGDSGYDDGFEDDGEEPFKFEALHHYLATVPDDDLDDDEDIEESDGCIADAEDEADMQSRRRKRRVQ